MVEFNHYKNFSVPKVNCGNNSILSAKRDFQKIFNLRSTEFIKTLRQRVQIFTQIMSQSKQNCLCV